MTWGALLLVLFLVVAMRTRVTRGGSAMLPTLVATAAVLGVVYINLGKG